jgi:hypothetical protein
MDTSIHLFNSKRSLLATSLSLAGVGIRVVEGSLSTSCRFQATRTTERSIGHSRPVSAIKRVPVRVELFN